MKEATVEQLSQDVRTMLAEAQHERILITSGGKPVAVLVGIVNKDEEDLRLETSPEFWQMIEERRGSPTVKLSDVEAQLLAGP